MRRALLAALSLVLVAGQAMAASVRCHYDYGGASHSLIVRPLARAQDAYRVAPTEIGSYFLLRFVWQARAPASFKAYVYAEQDDLGQVPIHQATWPQPRGHRQGPYGFTGRQTVYEPVRDSELHYWCERLR